MGDKPYEAWFRPFVSAYIGVEHGATFAATAAGARGRPDVVYGAGTLPFRDGCFDTVLSVQVLEHTPRPAALMAEMSRVLAPGGVLILTAPFQFRLHEQPHDYFRYSPHGLRQLCADAGLDVFETIAQGSLWTVIGHKLNTYLALRVARAGQLAQGMGKLGHEAPQGQGVRWWTLPFVGPSVVSIAAGRSLARPLVRRSRRVARVLGARAPPSPPRLARVSHDSSHPTRRLAPRGASCTTSAESRRVRSRRGSRVFFHPQRPARRSA